MKKHFFVSAIMALTLGMLVSCDTEGTTDDPNVTGTNYWNSNSLTRMQLLGSVRTLVQDEAGYQATYTFNADGNLTSYLVVGRYVTNYTYQGGKLTSETMQSTTTNYEYANVGKYVPLDSYDLYEKGLVPGLSAIIKGSERTDYVFSGSNLLIIHKYNGTPMDTATFQYTGNYPTGQTFVTPWHTSTLTITYAANGMFKSYSNQMSGQGFQESRVLTFKADDTFQLKDKSVNSNTFESQTNTSTTNYTYNDKKFLTESVSDTDGTIYEGTRFTDYVYDDKGNWTSRKVSMYNTLTQVWQVVKTETRTITYY